MVISRKALLTSLIAVLFMMALSIWRGVPLLPSLVMSTFLLILLQAIFQFNSLVYTLYLISYFVFLLGREFLFYYTGLQRYYIFSSAIERHTMICVLLNMISTYVAYLLISIRQTTIRSIESSSKRIEQKDSDIIVYGMLLLFTILPYIIYLLHRVSYVRQFGYIESYSTEVASDSSPIFNVLRIVGSSSYIAYYGFISSRPRRLLRVPAHILYLFASALIILAGRRAEFVANILVFVVMLFASNLREDTTVGISPRFVVIAVIAAPLLLSFLFRWDFIRSNRVVEQTSVVESAVSFLDQQGGSINVIKREKYYESSLPDDVVYSFSNTLNFLFANPLIRPITGWKNYSRNSIEHALEGNSLAHTISYYSLGFDYLRGRGFGTCYIAENYHDFGYFGVCLGAICYAYVIAYLSKFSNSHIVQALKLISLKALFISSRNSFDSPITTLLQASVILGLVAVFLLDALIRSKRIAILSERPRPFVLSQD